MTGIIVQSKEMVTLVGGGDVSPSTLDSLQEQTAFCVAADGGARHLIAAGRIPDAVMGDFDSLDASLRDQIPADRMHHIPEQDSTDFEKCLSRIKAPLVLAAGFMGPRTDHQLATFHGLLRSAHQPCILVGDHQIVCLCPPMLDLISQDGDLVSLFPMGRATATSSGLHWPLDSLPLAPGQMIGTSNRATGTSVTIKAETPNLLLILPRSKLVSLTTALLQARARWPALAG